MFDLWYAVGTGIMFPDLVDQSFITQANECFFNVPQHVGPKGAPPAQLPPWLLPPILQGSDSPAGGYINEGTISDFRNLIATGLQRTLSPANGDYPPAISLHTAATLSQWVAVPLFAYTSKLNRANAAFKAVSGQDSGLYSTGFRALLGVLFIDPRLPAAFVDPIQSQRADAIAAEFHLQAQERVVINSFANAVRPDDAAAAHLTNAPQGGMAFAATAGGGAIPAAPPTVVAPALIDQTSMVAWQQCTQTLLVWPGHTTGMIN